MVLLITGIHGFVGSNLSPALMKGHEIYGLDIVAPDKEGVLRTFKWKDLENNTFPPFDAVIHLAGKAHDSKNQSRREEYFEVNTNLTKRVFDFFLQSDAKKFIYFSTVKAVADKVDGILTEDVTPSPRGPYGESKLDAERYLLEEYEKYEGAMGRESDEPTLPNDDLEAKGRGNRNEKRLYILRPCMIHGPGNKGNLNSLVSMVKNGIPYPLGAFDNRRSFTSIDNLCFVINELITHNIPSGIYNIADDEPVSTNNLVRLIAEVSGKRGKIWKINRKAINFSAIIGSFLHLPFNKDTLQKLTENYIVSNEKINSALKISKMPTEAEEGLRITIDAMMHQ